MNRVFINLLTIFAITLVFIAPPAQGRSIFSLVADGSPRVLTLDDCFDVADVNNISMQQAKLGVDLSLAGLYRADGQFDPSIQAGLTGSESAGSANAANQTSSSGTTVYDLGLKYLLPTDNGSAWNFTVDQSRSNGSITSNGTSTSFTTFGSSIGLGYSLELLEGSDTLVNRLAIDQANIGVLRSQAQVNDSARTLRNGIFQAFFGAILATKQIDVDQASLDNAQNLVLSTDARIKAGQLAPYELLAAQAGLAQREEALITAKTQLKTSIDALKTLIGLPITEDVTIDTSILQPITMSVYAHDLFDLAQKNRPDYFDIDLQYRQAQLSLRAAEDRVQPTLAWNTTVGVSGKDKNYFDTLGRMGDFTWTTGLQYSLPLGGNKIAEADLITAKLNIQQIDLTRTDFLRNLMRDISAAVDDFDNAVQLIDIASQGLKVQEVKMESERARLALGLITSKDLLQFDLDLANARLAYESAMIDAFLAVGKMEFLTGVSMLDDVMVMHGAAPESYEQGASE
jgi:outer membrane protein